MNVVKGQEWKFYLSLDSGVKEFITKVTSVKNGMVHHYHFEDGKKYWGKMGVDTFIKVHEFVK